MQRLYKALLSVVNTYLIFRLDKQKHKVDAKCVKIEFSNAIARKNQLVRS